jgi:hypothetical protein
MRKAKTVAHLKLALRKAVENIYNDPDTPPLGLLMLEYWLPNARTDDDKLSLNLVYIPKKHRDGVNENSALYWPMIG